MSVVEDQDDDLHLIERIGSSDEAIRNLKVSLATSAARILKPVPRIRGDEWADRYRKLGSDSDMQGPFRVSTVEVARGPFAAITEPGVREMTCVGPTQLFKTTTGEVAIGYFMHLDSCPILVYQPKDETARAFAKKKLLPMIDATPALRKRAGTHKGKNPDATITYRKFPGGDITISSVGSSTNLAMISARVAILDEIDKYVDTNEGDPIALAQKRLTKYRHNSLAIYTCSPTNAHSRIMQQYSKSDQRKPMIRCPHCDEKQVLDWGTKDSAHGVKWGRTEEGKHDPESALYYCRACGAGISDAQRLRALRSVRWYQTKGFHCCGERQDPLNNDIWDWDEWGQVHYALCRHCHRRAVPNRHAGFWASNLYSPFRTLGDMARSFLEAQSSPTRLQTFINTELAQTFDEVGEEIDPDSLKARVEAFPAEVPDAAHVVIATVDTQDDRLECLRVAVNLLTEELWVLDQTVFPGDTGQSEPWDMLDEFLKEKLHRRDGVAFVPVVVGIDIQGHRRDIAQRFVHRRVGRGFYALSGKAERNGQRSDIWPGNPSHRNRLKLPIYQISVNAAKDLLASRLSITERERQGYVHFSDRLNDEFFDQLTSEHAVPKNIGGKWVHIWELKADKRRNEAFDLMVYAYAMIRCLQNLPERYTKRLRPPPIRDVEGEESGEQSAAVDSFKQSAQVERKEKPEQAEGREEQPPPARAKPRLNLVRRKRRGIIRARI